MIGVLAEKTVFLEMLCWLGPYCPMWEHLSKGTMGLDAGNELISLLCLTIKIGTETLEKSISC